VAIPPRAARRWRHPGHRGVRLVDVEEPEADRARRLPEEARRQHRAHPRAAGAGRRAVTADAVHYYWRGGCPFCASLRRGLDKLGIQTVDHNIWEDPDAAATVRFHANGNETVPTVVI